MSLQNKKNVAHEWLIQFLSTGAQFTSTIEKAGKIAGFSMTTLERCKRGSQGRIKADRQGNLFFWKLADDSALQLQPVQKSAKPDPSDEQPLSDEQQPLSLEEERQKSEQELRQLPEAEYNKRVEEANRWRMKFVPRPKPTSPWEQFLPLPDMNDNVERTCFEVQIEALVTQLRQHYDPVWSLGGLGDVITEERDLKRRADLLLILNAVEVEYRRQREASRRLLECPNCGRMVDEDSLVDDDKLPRCGDRQDIEYGGIEPTTFCTTCHNDDTAFDKWHFERWPQPQKIELMKRAVAEADVLRAQRTASGHTKKSDFGTLLRNEASDSDLLRRLPHEVLDFILARIIGEPGGWLQKAPAFYWDVIKGEA